MPANYIDGVTIKGTGYDLHDTEMRNAFIDYLRRKEPDYFTDFAQIASIVQRGKAQEYFELGDQLITTWNNGSNDYDLPWDVVSFGSVVDGQGNTHENAMWIQSHYCLTGIQFSGNNAFYVPTAEMPAGTYHFTIGNSWGKKVVANKVYQFTLTTAVPVGGQLVLGTASSNASGLPDIAPANWRVRTFANGLQNTPTEIVTLSEGTGGTDLGTLSSSTKYAESGINNMQRAAYGYNRYAHSAIRQWLNSAGAREEWWEQKNPFDHRPDQLATVQGFMAGLPQDFLQIIKPVKVTTALNTISDVDIGTSEDVVDKFFLPSLEQEYIVPQASGVEGSFWQYWKDRLGLNAPQAWYNAGTNAHHIRYAYENHTSAQACRLRSASRDYASCAWSVDSTGYAGYGNATVAFRCAPACVIY